MKNKLFAFHNIFLENKDNFFENNQNSKNCFKCFEKTEKICQINKRDYFICYKCCSHWKAIRAKYYLLASKEFLNTPRQSKEK